jgi:RNA polymerase sigma-70 factor (ECF subfamily)
MGSTPAAGATERADGMSSSSDAKADERALVIAAQRGSSDAFASLVRLHQRRAYAVCRAIVLTHEDAEDAVQEGFLHAFKALDRFLPDQPFGAWLFRIMANASLDLVRRRKVRDADELPETIALPFRDPGESDELRRRLNEALTKLTDRQRSGIPEGTARSDLHHARAALRRILKDVRSDL